MAIQDMDEQVWISFHGGKLADVFRNSVGKVIHPQGIMRQNVLVFDLMSRLQAEGLLMTPETVREGARILHEKADSFEKSPYQYCVPHNINFAFAHDEVLERLEKLVGHPTDMPKEYAERMSSMLQKIREFGSSQQIRRAFNL